MWWWGGGMLSGRRAGVARKRGARSGRRGSPSAPGGGPASGRPPLPVDRPPRPPPGTPLLAPPPFPAVRARARVRARVWGRKPARRPARPRSWPRFRGCVPWTVTRGTPRRRPPVARLPPVRGRVVPCGAPPWASASGRGGAAASPCPSRASRGGAWRGVVWCGVRPVPGSCSFLRSRPAPAGGGRGAVGRGSLSRAPPLAGPVSSPPRRDLRSDVATR